MNDMNDKLDKLIEQNNGYLKVSDALSENVSRAVLDSYIEANELQRMAHGLYMAETTWEDTMFIIQVRYPHAVFSHETSLFLLDMAIREPNPISVTMKTGASSSRLAKEGIKVYKVKHERFDLGLIVANTPFGNEVRAYNAERTLCDLFRSRSNIELHVLDHAIKTYLSLKEKNIPQLLRYASAFSVQNIIQKYLEILL